MGRKFQSDEYSGKKVSASSLFPGMAPDAGDLGDSDEDEDDAAEQLRAALEAADAPLADDEDSDEDESESDDDEDAAGEAEDVVAALEKEEEHGLRLVSRAAKDEADRGKSALEQLRTFDKLLEVRIRLQPLLAAGNRAPRPPFFGHLAGRSKAVGTAAARARAETAALVSAFLAVSRARAAEWPAVAASLREQDASLGLGDVAAGPASRRKRQRAGSRDGDGGGGGAVGTPGLCLDPVAVSAALRRSAKRQRRETGGDEQEGDEEGSDTETEGETPSDALWACLSSQWERLLPPAEAALDGAAESVGLSAGLRKGSALSRAPSAQAKEASQDADVVRRRAHPRAADVKVLGQRVMVSEGDLDEEAYDDSGLYHALLKDLTSAAEPDARGSGVDRQVIVAGASSHKAGLKRVTRTVDRRATKGRRLKYTTVEELVGFLAPRPRHDAPVEVAAVVASLFQSDA